MWLAIGRLDDSTCVSRPTQKAGRAINTEKEGTVERWKEARERERGDETAAPEDAGTTHAFVRTILACAEPSFNASKSTGRRAPSTEGCPAGSRRGVGHLSYFLRHCVCQSRCMFNRAT